MIKKIKTKIVASIKNRRFNVFLLFLLSSFIILIITKLSKNYTGTLPFQIKKVNVPEEKVILKDSNTTLAITLKTHGFKWLKYYFIKPEIAIDFSNEVSIKQGMYVYSKPVSYLNVKKQFSNNHIQLLGVNPDTIVFRYDTNMVKKVPIVVNADVSFAPGYNILNGYSIKPDSIRVIGPHKLVESLKQIETEKIVLTNLKTSVARSIKIKLPKDHQNLKLSKTEIDFSANVEKFTEGKVKLPIKVINIPKNQSIKIFPKEVTVSYYTSLNNYNIISSKDFQVVCDYKKTKGNQLFLIPELTKVAKGVKNIKIDQQRIEFIILK